MKNCIENNTVLCRRMRYLMNTFCEIRVEGVDGIYIEEAVERTFSELRRIEGLFSRYLGGSEVTKLNREAARSVVNVAPEVFQLIVRSLELSRMTSGAFDVSIGAAVDLWRESENKNTLPAENQIREALENMGYQNIIPGFAERSIYFGKPGLSIDFGALAKGYGLDKAAAVLREDGIMQAQINLGGNIYVIDNQPQTIAIRNPLSPDEIITTVDLFNNSISTSANYERFFTIGNEGFGHLLNPLTGYPIVSDILSVSVVSPDASLADALSTAIFILGFDKGKEFVGALKDVESVIICKRGFGNRVKVLKLEKERRT